MSDNYYRKVGDYYDEDALDFEARYWDNQVLQRIRQSFREEVKRHPAKNILEVGFGPGFDLIHFARIFPESQLFGVDVSQEMVNIADAKIAENALENAMVAQGSVEHIKDRFPGQKFDMIYVFFGALNTVDDLSAAAKELQKVLSPGGTMILTFVNKWYVGGMLIELLKLKFRSAFLRLRPVWGGYSPTKFLASTCYSPRQIRKAFAPLHCEKWRGYSIVYPAWYYRRIHSKIPRSVMAVLWNVDEKIARGVFGGLGEYALYVFRHK